MGKRIWIAIIIVLLLGAVGGYLWWEDQKPKDLSLWSLVPSSAVAVYECQDPVRIYERLQEKDLWLDLESLPWKKNLQSSVDSLVAAQAEGNELEALFKKTPALVSLHRTSSKQWDYLFLFRLGEGERSKAAKDLIQHFLSQDGYKLDQRNYRELVINQIKATNGEALFSYLVYQGYFIGSFTPFLVEDVIRSVQEKREGFADQNPGIFQVQKLEDDFGNVYLNLRSLQRLRSIFAAKPLLAQNPFQGLGQSATLDLNLTDQAILMNGFSMSSEDSSQFLEVFRGQPSGRYRQTPYLPLRAYSVGYSIAPRVNEWMASLQVWARSQIGAEYRKAEGQLKHLSVDPAPFRSALTGQVSLVHLQTVDASQDSRLLIVGLQDKEAVETWLRRTVESLNLARGTEVAFSEVHDGYTIGQLDFQEMPYALFFGQYAGFEECYFALVDEQLIMANRLQVLKTSLSDIRLQNTWDKSVALNIAMEDNQDESNFGFFFLPKRGKGALENSLHQEWSADWQNRGRSLDTFDFLALQFTWLAGKYYTSLNLHYGAPQGQAPRTNDRVSEQAVGEVKGNLVGGPWLHRSHLDQKIEALAQSDSNTLFFFNSEGKALWSQPLSGPVVGQVLAMDFYNNGKKQYLACTQDSMYVFDRNGNTVSDYPKALPADFRPTSISLIDYDNSKNYRIALSDEIGLTYLTDKEANILEGWDPLLLSEELAKPLSHVRVSNKDLLLALQKNGNIQVLNRRGKNYRGFPADLNGKWRGDYFFTPGPTLERSKISLINLAGELVTFNFVGQVEERKQLYRATSTSEFELVSDALGKDFLILRRDPGLLTVLNMEGEEIFSQPLPGSSKELSFQYYHFSPENRVLALNNPSEGSSTLFTLDGALLSGAAIPSTGSVGLMYFQKSQSYLVYTISGRQYRLLGIGS